ncbi:WXG100 family type VII secretion target [Kineothrix alysoides]|uniref:ESAT-6-like protein n=1 Tax=Kineothrix alysoides TaxID=1469948 RepID=A0A4V2QC62_9FIRM|nr:WXG100 family type VII secretion target [Kineothrix alysoides]TCL59037.1 WXG100 family type VII secretion target [Kineothrix alysoides]
MSTATTVDLQKMKNVAGELDKIYANMMNQIKKLDEAVGNLQQLWKGEAAQAYQNAYKQNTTNFLQLAEAINSCSSSLTTIATTYNKADTAAADAIKSKMGGRK